MADMDLTCTMQPAGVVHGIMKALLKIKMGRTRAREGVRRSENEREQARAKEQSERARTKRHESGTTP